MKVYVPKDNVNDEFVIVEKIYVTNNEKAEKNKLILDLETSKTAIAIETPKSGYINLHVQEGDEISIGSCLFEVLDKIGAKESEINNSEDTNDNLSNLDKYIINKDAKALLDKKQITNFYSEKKMVTLEDVKKFISKDSQNHEDAISISSKKLYKPPHNKNISDLPTVSYDEKNFTLRKRAEINNLTSNGNISTQSVIGIEIKCLPTRSYSVPYMFKESISDIVTFEASKLLVDFPELNSFYLNEKQYGAYDQVNAGFSFDNDSNLKVLSIENSDKLTLKEVQNKIIELLDLFESNQTINEKLLTSTTFTISDLSNVGATYMLPLVSSNQSSIIGIIKRNSFTYDIYVGFDHKISSGLYVSKFLQKLKTNVESHFFNEDRIKYMKCDKCEISASELKAHGSIGFIKITKFDGGESNICENCFNGY